MIATPHGGKFLYIDRYLLDPVTELLADLALNRDDFHCTVFMVTVQNWKTCVGSAAKVLPMEK
ncbi:hypothetical protein [Chryseobacterium sp. ISL-6]|uniref:hypothetical protein n=1 Tax=Chryseobacterium sp. ISL-6 TaxID=2819143 RepID=UPI001BE8C0F0|nr:hypothetical protein [Chryseobacterium sp. ISL-6]MBT2621863.1 hypothetical protein [Chryseobacterium sp. ISL-6]